MGGFFPKCRIIWTTHLLVAKNHQHYLTGSWRHFLPGQTKEQVFCFCFICFLTLQLFLWQPVSCIISTPLTALMLCNPHIKGFKHFKHFMKRKPLGRCFNPTKNQHSRLWLSNVINVIKQICTPWSNKPPPCCLPDSQEMHHFLGHCFLPSPPSGT